MATPIADSTTAAGAPTWLEGAVDLHVHAAPSLFPRWGDGADVARVCRDAGMRGLLLKAHEGSTVEAANVLTATHEPLRVAGGVVLNRYVGGINPSAAEVALRLGGRCIWFPTIDSDDHVRAYGSTGAYHHQRGGLEDAHGVTVLDADGKLTAPAREILALARDHEALVATGHLGEAAIDAVLRVARDLGLTRLLVQHPCFSTPNLGLDAIARAVDTGAYVELTYLAVSPMWSETTLDRCVEVLRRFAGSVVVSSDAGQAHSPAPPEALRSFAQSLHERGGPAEVVHRALVETPAELLGW